jgi:hypothetical protein
MGKRSSNAKVWGKTANPCFAGHALMDNRHSLITDVSITPSVSVSELEAALLLLHDRAANLRAPRASEPKGYHTHRFVVGVLATALAIWSARATATEPKNRPGVPGH